MNSSITQVFYTLWVVKTIVVVRVFRGDLDQRRMNVDVDAFSLEVVVH